MEKVRAEMKDDPLQGGSYCPYCQPIDYESNAPKKSLFLHLRKGEAEPLLVYLSHVDSDSLYYPSCSAQWRFTRDHDDLSGFHLEKRPRVRTVKPKATTSSNGV